MVMFECKEESSFTIDHSVPNPNKIVYNSETLLILLKTLVV